MEHEIELELKRILIQETSGQQFIFLQERFGQRSFPIVIGTAEAFAIDRRLKGVDTPRPLTHDLIFNVITGMDGKLEKVFINDLREVMVNGRPESTYFAQLIIRRHNEIIKIDSRPSDAIALGIVNQTPIFIAEHVLDAATS